MIDTPKPRMSLETFVTFLEKTKGLYEWEVSNGGYLRGEMMIHPDQVYCPITAVYEMLFDQYVPLSQYSSAGKKLGLTPATINKIVTAADDHHSNCAEKMCPPYQHSEEYRKTTRYKRIRALRNQMLDVLDPKITVVMQRKV